MAEKITYWQFHPLLRTWVLKTGDDGCELCTDENVQLSMSRPPPALRDQPVPPRKESALMAWSDKQRLNDPYDNVFEGIAKTVQACRRFNTWLDNPPPTSRKATSAEKRHQTPEVPNFDIAEIPNVIRKLGMPKAADVMDKWFKGELNYSLSDKESQKEIDQYGNPYRGSMIDTRSIKMDWILSFPRAQREFKKLKTNEILETTNSLDEIKKIAQRSCQRYRIEAWEQSGRNIQNLHNEFQFQFLSVDGSAWQKFKQHGKQLWSAGGIPDELSFILGGFNIYAAIAYADFTTNQRSRSINITHIYLYVRDSFSFTDEADKASQYLGHWSKKGVAVVPLKQATALLDVDWIDIPTLHKTRLGLSVMYPVKNSDFRKWQLLHKQGGDYMIYTDKKIAKLDPPISISF